VLPAIPKSEGVVSAFRLLAKKLEATRKKINTQAAKDMKADKYDAAQKRIGIGRAVADFAQRAEAFADEWKRLTKASKLAAAKPANEPLAGSGKPSTRTPTWKFCVPALKTLAASDAEMTFDQVLAGVEKQVSSILTESDLAIFRDKPRWHATLLRAHRQCQREGWIEKRRDGAWKITPKGNATAMASAATAGTSGRN
jgi:hypothetical protein